MASTDLCPQPADSNVQVQMGHATAEAVVRAGLQLVPFSFTGVSEAVAVSNIGVSGMPVEVVGPERRQEAMASVQHEFPGVIVIDFTLPTAVNGASAAALPPLLCSELTACYCAQRTPGSMHTITCRS